MIVATSETALEATSTQARLRSLGLSRSPCLWLSVTCLDAPVVAAVWQWTFARAFGTTIGPGPRVVLFTAAWLIYLVDRIADSFTLPPQAPTSARQLFCLRYRRQMLILAISLGIADAILSVTLLDVPTLLCGAIIGTAITLYLAVNHFAGFVWRTVPLKEVTVGFLFALGATAAVHAVDTKFIAALICFGALCSLNCLSISFWERDLDLAQGRQSFATTWSTLRALPAVGCTGLTAIAICLVAYARLQTVLVPIVGSAVLLALLNCRRSLSRDERVALADLVLLTPILTNWFV